MSKLFFFRHAQASYGAANYDKLSPKGEKQAQILGNYLMSQDIHFDKIYVGPLRRQQHTFEIVKEVYTTNGRSIPEAVMIQGLNEHSGPEATAKAFPHLLENVPQIKKWFAESEENPALKKKNNLLYFRYFMNEWASGNLPIEGVQTWAEFRTEVKTGLQTILENTEKGQTIGAFTSGGTISSITAEALNMTDQKRIASMNFSVRNTSFTTFFSSNNTFNLLSFNELPHLDKEMITFV